MSFKVIIVRDFDHMSEAAAKIVIDDISKKQSQNRGYVLGLATGNSPTGLYKHLAKAVNSDRIDPCGIKSFNLDEYVGLPGENAQQRALHPESYSFFMIRELFGLMKRPLAKTHVPWGTLIDQAMFEKAIADHPGDWSLQGEDKGKALVIRRDADSPYLKWIQTEILDGYEQQIRAAGGIDLHIVGVGGRGHVGFHEAGIPFEKNRMLLVKLDENTVENAVKDGHFESRDKSPFYAVSMGAELIYEAKTVLLLASGARKAESVATSLRMKKDCSVPISYGHVLSHNGGRMLYVIDRAAAEQVLSHRDEVARLGVEVEDLSEKGAEVLVEDLLFSRDPASGLVI